MSSITIRDVARKAGVSTATVSRVMNGNGKIRAETAERVQDAVRALGFRPSAMGRGLKTARTRTLGVLLPSLSNPIFADAAEGIQESAQAAGYSVFITCNNYDPAAEQRAVDTMLEQRVEAMILTVADAERNDQLIRLERERVPHVLIFNPASPRARNVVTVDNEEAGRLVGEEFTQLGHQRLGMIAGRFVASDRSRARYHGFCKGAEAAGVDKPELIEVDFIDGRIVRTIATLYANTNPPTGLF
jgi:DNA-binding LacI/PurR family transcriptional regulator